MSISAIPGSSSAWRIAGGRSARLSRGAHKLEHGGRVPHRRAASSGLLVLQLPHLVIAAPHHRDCPSPVGPRGGRNVGHGVQCCVCKSWLSCSVTPRNDSVMAAISCSLMVTEVAGPVMTSAVSPGGCGLTATSSQPWKDAAVTARKSIRDLQVAEVVEQDA